MSFPSIVPFTLVLALDNSGHVISPSTFAPILFYHYFLIQMKQIKNDIIKEKEKEKKNYKNYYKINNK